MSNELVSFLMGQVWAKQNYSKAFTTVQANDLAIQQLKSVPDLLADLEGKLSSRIAGETQAKVKDFLTHEEFESVITAILDKFIVRSLIELQFLQSFNECVTQDTIIRTKDTLKEKHLETHDLLQQLADSVLTQKEFSSANREIEKLLTDERLETILKPLSIEEIADAVEQKVLVIPQTTKQEIETLFTQQKFAPIINPILLDAVKDLATFAEIEAVLKPLSIEEIADAVEQKVLALNIPTQTKVEIEATVKSLSRNIAQATKQEVKTLFTADTISPILEPLLKKFCTELFNGHKSLNDNITQNLTIILKKLGQLPQRTLSAEQVKQIVQHSLNQPISQLLSRLDTLTERIAQLEEQCKPSPAVELGFEPQSEPFKSVWMMLGGSKSGLGWATTEQVEQNQFSKQYFERGVMYWWGDAPHPQTNKIWVLTHPHSTLTPKTACLWAGGSWHIHADEPPTSPNQDHLYCDEARHKKAQGGPIRGFGKLWCENKEVRELVGDCIEPEDGTGRTHEPGQIQRFENGVMLFNPINDEIFVLFNQAGWLRFPVPSEPPDIRWGL